LIREDLGDGIVRLVLNRGPVNALSADLLMLFARELEVMAEDDGVRALVLASAFGVFSAGLDLKQAQRFDPDAQRAIVAGLNVGFTALYRFPGPVVAEVGGAAIAGGLFFVLGADHRVAGPRARFGLAEVRVGVDFPVAPMEIARAELAPADLRRLMLSGQPVGVEAALAAGIIDEMADDVAARAEWVALRMADIPPRAYAAVKRQIRGPALARIEAAMAAGMGVASWFTEETAEAMARMIGDQ
jgi:enoyl-CoA hydratase/carnithine racemase